MQAVRREVFKARVLSQVPVKYAGPVEPSKPRHVPKVTEKLVWLHVVDTEGIKHVVPAYEGESLLYTLTKNLLPIPGACLGGDQYAPETEDPVDPMRYGPTCELCQVVIADPWVKYLKPLGKWEKDRLTKTETGFFTPSSRLSCCLSVEKWMNGMVVTVPYNVDPRPEGVDWPYEMGENRIFRF
jgi:ferredoxin